MNWNDPYDPGFWIAIACIAVPFLLGWLMNGI